MKYQIETITKDNAWVYDESTGLTFEVYFSCFVDGEEEGACWVLNSGVYFVGTDITAGNDLEEFIVDAVYAELDASEAYHEMLTDKSDYYYDLYKEEV